MSNEWFKPNKCISPLPLFFRISTRKGMANPEHQQLVQKELKPNEIQENKLLSGLVGLGYFSAVCNGASSSFVLRICYDSSMKFDPKPLTLSQHCTLLQILKILKKKKSSFGFNAAIRNKWINWVHLPASAKEERSWLVGCWRAGGVPREYPKELYQGHALFMHVELFYCFPMLTFCAIFAPN